MDIELVVFDFDGTLVNLNQDVSKLRKKLRVVAKRYGVELAFRPMLDDIKKLKELAGDEAFREALDTINKDDLELAKIAEPIDSANAVCQKLKAMGLKLAVFSRNYSLAIRQCLERLNFPEFDLVLGRFEGGETKIDQLRTILERFKVNPGKTVVIGDHVLDVRAGRELGCISIGIRNDRFNEEKLKEEGADFVIGSPEELLEVLNR